MVLMIVRLDSTLSDEEMGKVVLERLPRFKALPGLIEKYYSRMREGARQYAGIYLWDSLEAMGSFLGSELYRSLTSAYRLANPPIVEVFEIGLRLSEC